MQLQICICISRCELWPLSLAFLIQYLHAPNFYCPFHNTPCLEGLRIRVLVVLTCIYMAACSSSNETLCWVGWQIYHVSKCTPWVQLGLFCTVFYLCGSLNKCSSSSNVTFSVVGWRRCQWRWCVVERKTHRPSSTRRSSQGELYTKALVFSISWL